jgi:hypothetical protein
VFFFPFPLGGGGGGGILIVLAEKFMSFLVDPFPIYVICSRFFVSLLFALQDSLYRLLLYLLVFMCDVLQLILTGLKQGFFQVGFIFGSIIHVNN